MTTRREFLAGTVAASAALALGSASAQAWPSRPIRIVVPLPPGGVADFLARALSEPLRVALGQPVVVENRVGADGRIGTEYASKQPADGYTFSTLGTSNVAHTALFKSLPYDLLNDFAPVTQIARTPFVLVVGPGLQLGSAREYLAYARANPGKITFGSSGIGSPFHLSGERLKSMTGVSMLHVPYKGTGPIIAALLSGELMSAFVPIGPFLPHIRSGKFRALGIVSAQPTPNLPDVPTLESAFPLPGFVVDAWVGLLAPAGTDKAIVERLSAEIRRIIREPQFLKEHILRQSYEPLGTTPDEMRAVLKEGVAFYAKVVRDAKIPSE
jgi:tripartite-type tricarboxylate transporter receptor subunit TctC